jgi:hypothetical protein
VPIRQWVVTFPHRVRFLCAYDPGLCSAVRRIVVRAIGGLLKRRARARGITDPRVGAVVALQRFDQALRTNLHIHSLWPDGVFEIPPFPARAEFWPDMALEPRDIERVVRAIRDRVIRMLVARGRWPEADAGAEDDDTDGSPLAHLAAAAVEGRLAFGPDRGAPAHRVGQGTQDARRPRGRDALCAECDGFTVHAGVRIGECAKDRREKLARYALRPPLVHDRLSLSKDGSHVIYAFRRPFRDGSTHVVLRLHEFIGRLAALIPRPRAHLVTYYGVFAPAASARDRVVPAPPAEHLVEKSPRCEPRAATKADAQPPELVAKPRKPYSWAELLRRVYRVEALVCDRCGGPRRLLAAIFERDAIRKLLAHLGLPTEPLTIQAARPPPEPSFEHCS